MVRKGLLIALFACLPYLNALNNPFVYDDHDTVVANPSLVDLSNVRFLIRYAPFRPVVNLSYAADRWLWGFRPLGFHLTSILLHAAVALLLFLLVRRILEDARGPATRSSMFDAIAFGAAALFAVHPLHTEAVGYVSGRSELLCGVWFLAAVVLARDSMIAGGWVRGALAFLCALLSILSKEVGLVLPLIVIAYDWLLKPGDDALRRQRWRWFFLPGLAAATAIGVYRFMALRHAIGEASPLLNGLTQAIVIWRYVGLLVWPSGQSVMHDVHHVVSLADPLAIAAAIGVALVVGIAFWLRRRAPATSFGLVWFFLVLAPSSSIVSLSEGMAEHRVYLASAGIFIAMAGLAAALISVPRRGAAVLPAKYVAAGAVLVTVLCVLTVMRNRVWQSPVALWGEAVAHAEGLWQPHYALADALRESGNCVVAIGEYERVVELNPSNRDAYVNLGICLAQTGRLDAAEGAFRRTLEIDPGFVRAYTNLGALALVEGDAERARDFYLEAIARDPRNVLARMQLASLYEHTFQDYHSAARMCGEARAIAPSTPGVVECVERNQQLAGSQDHER